MVRVAVTTTAGRSARKFGGLLEAAGLEPVYLPCITVKPAPAEDLARVRTAAEDADWIIVTSSRAVEIVWADGEMPPGPKVAAVGPATADAVYRAGATPAVVGDGGAAALRNALSGQLAGTSVVFAHARAGDPATIAWLCEEADHLVAIPAYDTVPIPPDNDPVDVAVFGSPSSVTGWTLSRALDGVTLAAMGETTSAHLASMGHPPGIVPERPGFETLAAAVAAHTIGSERSRM